MDKKSLKNKANQIRADVINVAMRYNAGHIAPSLSCVDILVALYYGGSMRYKVKKSYWEDRDRLIFSKAHGCYSLYAILADKGIIPKWEWDNFYGKKSTLLGCMERRLEYGLEAGCGSLGHGLPIAAGIAFGARLQNKKYHVFCITGDGEMQEGSNWEALRFAVKHGLDNLIVIIDANRLQAMDFIVNVLDKKADDDFRRLKGFGLAPVICPGHDAARLSVVINKARMAQGKTPKVIIAETVKGFGLKCMENIPKFHFRVPTKEELKMGGIYECRT